MERHCKNVSRRLGWLSLLVAAVMIPMSLSGCNTVEGAGEDIEGTGEAIEDTSRDLQD